jgi:hypothetical protein
LIASNKETAISLYKAMRKLILQMEVVIKDTARLALKQKRVIGLEVSFVVYPMRLNSFGGSFCSTFEVLRLSVMLTLIKNSSRKSVSVKPKT